MMRHLVYDVIHMLTRTSLSRSKGHEFPSDLFLIHLSSTDDFEIQTYYNHKDHILKKSYFKIFKGYHFHIYGCRYTYRTV